MGKINALLLEVVAIGPSISLDWISFFLSYYANLCSTQAGLQFCTYEVSIEFGSMLLPQIDGRTVVPLVSSFVEGLQVCSKYCPVE